MSLVSREVLEASWDGGGGGPSATLEESCLVGSWSRLSHNHPVPCLSFCSESFTKMKAFRVKWVGLTPSGNNGAGRWAHKPCLADVHMAGCHHWLQSHDEPDLWARVVIGSVHTCFRKQCDPGGSPARSTKELCWPESPFINQLASVTLRVSRDLFLTLYS